MLIGTLTRDPELRATPKGTPVTEVSLAINRFFVIEGGERREETVFVDVELWGRQAEVAAAYLRKGRPAFIEGRLRLDSWDDKQTGQKRSKLKVVGELMQMLGNRGDHPATEGDSTSVPAAKKPAAAPSGGNFVDFEDAPF